MRPLKEIIVHCTATRPDWMASKALKDKVAEIRRWHVQGNGWSDIGYHYLIDRNGTIASGRPLNRTGAHVRGRNKGSIGIALLGGHGGSETDSFEDHFTPEQDAALRALIGDLQAEYGSMSVNGHNQYSAKACPCFDAPGWYNNAPTSRKYLPAIAERVMDDADKAPAKSKTNWAGIGTAAAGGWQAIQTSDWRVQLAAIAVVALGLFLVFERNRKGKLARDAKEALGL